MLTHDTHGPERHLDRRMLACVLGGAFLLIVGALVYGALEFANGVVARM